MSEIKPKEEINPKEEDKENETDYEDKKMILKRYGVYYGHNI